MAQVHVAMDILPEALAAAIAAARAGDEVLLEERGELVARVLPAPKQVDWQAFLRELDQLPAREAGFASHVLDAMSANNRPVEDVPWAS